MSIYPFNSLDALQVVLVFMQPSLIQTSAHPSALDFYKLDKHGGFFDFGSNCLMPSLIAADYSGCKAQALVKDSVDIEHWWDRVAKLENDEEAAARRAVSKRVSVVRDHPSNFKDPLRFYGGAAADVGEPTHVFLPFPDSDEVEIQALIQAVLWQVLARSPVKMVACLLSKEVLASRYEVQWLIPMGAVKLKSRPRGHGGDYIYFYTHDGVKVAANKIGEHQLSWSTVEQHVELAKALRARVPFVKKP